MWDAINEFEQLTGDPIWVHAINWFCLFCMIGCLMIVSWLLIIL